MFDIDNRVKYLFSENLYYKMILFLELNALMLKMRFMLIFLLIIISNTTLQFYYYLHIQRYLITFTISTTKHSFKSRRLKPKCVQP